MLMMTSFSSRLYATILLLVAAVFSLLGCAPAVTDTFPTVTSPSGVLNLAIPTKVVTPQPTAVPQLTFTPIPTSLATALSTTVLPSSTAVPLTPEPLPTENTPPNIFIIPAPDIPDRLPMPLGTLTETVRVPILMYHYVSDPPADADKYRIDLSVSPANFREQMGYLAENGYNTIDFYDLMMALSGSQPLPPNPVILTFDDGYVDNYEYAFPILEEFGLKGTFFIITEYVDFGNPHHMSWPMIEEMAAAGHRIESHTKTHPNLSALDWDGQLYQLLGSQQTLAAHLGYTPRFLCYPGGRYNEETLILLQELGYWGAVTTQSGKEHSFANRYEWQRMRIRNNTYLPEFAGIVRPPAGSAP